MKLLAIIFCLIPLLAFGGESYFFTFEGEATEKRIKDEKLHLVLPIKKMEPPKASSIFAFHQGLGRGRTYQIQVNLESTPQEGWFPSLCLDGEIILDGLSVSQMSGPKPPTTLCLEADDPEKITHWCKLLGKLMKVPANQIHILLDESQAADADDSK